MFFFFVFVFVAPGGGAEVVEFWKKRDNVCSEMIGLGMV